MKLLWFRPNGEIKAMQSLIGAGWNRRCLRTVGRKSIGRNLTLVLLWTKSINYRLPSITSEPIASSSMSYLFISQIESPLQPVFELPVSSSSFALHSVVKLLSSKFIYFSWTGTPHALAIGWTVCFHYISGLRTLLFKAVQESISPSVRLIMLYRACWLVIAQRILAKLSRQPFSINTTGSCLPHFFELVLKLSL